MRDQGVVDDQGFQNVLRVNWGNMAVEGARGQPESNRAYHPDQGAEAPRRLRPYRFGRP
ncbi:hypothetical protein GCM10007079_07760 [Nocardiopsis terrae]|nr:hypothetical protein GCM10007079_07760 [Nocardiopsis terrae]